MDRRTFIAASTLVVTCGSLRADKEKKVRVYYGTKNQSGSEGIYTGTMNLATGELSDPVLAAKAENPGFLAINHSKTHLYAVASGSGGQKIVSYKIDTKSGLLTELNSQEAR